MNEQNTIPPEMLEAATVRYMLSIGYSEQAVKMHRQDNDAAWQNNQRHTRLILEAAGVPALVARIAELERELAKVREVAHENFNYFEQQLSPEGREWVNMNKAEIEQFAVELTDKAETHDGWLAIVRFGMGAFQENQPLFIEIIVREAVTQLQRKNFAPLTISDEVRFIFEELGLRLTESQ